MHMAGSREQSRAGGQRRSRRGLREGTSLVWRSDLVHILTLQGIFFNKKTTEKRYMLIVKTATAAIKLLDVKKAFREI